MVLPLTLKAGYSCIFDGAGTILLYDDRGSLKKKYEAEWGLVKLDKGSHTLRVSCKFRGDAELVLKGRVKLKYKVEVLSAQ